VFRIRIDLNTDTDPDPAFEVNTDPDAASDPDSDPDFFMTKIKEIFLFENLTFFQSQIAINTRVSDPHPSLADPDPGF